ncbi:MAG: hypothetical protein ABII64_04360 [Elusimicrobiota bacterium]
MNFDITQIDLAVVNLLDVVRGEMKSKKEVKKPWLETLEFETIPVTNCIFQKEIDIREGINTIVAKPTGVQPKPGNIETKVVVLDKTSLQVELIEPSNDRIPYLKMVSGVIKKKPYPENVKVTIEALVPVKTGGESRYSLDKLMEVVVPVKKKQFSVPISVREMLTGDEIVVITVSYDGVEITKTLF